MLEAVDRGRGGARREAGVRRQPAGGGRAGQVQQIQALEIGGVEADARRHQIAHEHGLRAETASGFVQRLEQLLTRCGDGMLWNGLAKTKFP